MSAFHTMRSSSMAQSMVTRARTYASIVRGIVQANEVVAQTYDTERVFSMAELNEGSIALPRTSTERQVPLDVSEHAFSTRRILTGHIPAPHLAIGAERRAAFVKEPRYHPRFPRYPTYPTESTYHLATGLLDDYDVPQKGVWTTPTNVHVVHDIPLHHEVVPTSARAPTCFPSGENFYPYRHPGSRPLPRQQSSLSSSNSWESSPIFSSPGSAFSPSPPSPPPLPPVPVLRHQKLRARKYYGPFEACSREDILPEFRDDDFEVGCKPEKLEDGGVDGPTWLNYLRTLAENENAEPGKRSSDRGEGDGAAWSVQEMHRYNTAVCNRLLAAYHLNPAPVDVPTGLRGLPIVVQVRAVYPPKVWDATLADLELQSHDVEGL